MDETDPVAANRDHAGLERGIELALSARHRLEQRQRRVRAHRSGQQGLPHPRRQRGHSLVDKRLEVVQHGKGAAGLDSPALALERPSDLERVERVTARSLVKLPQQRPIGRVSKHRAKELEQRTQAERAHGQRLAPSRQRLCERRPFPTRSSAPDRKQEPHGLGTQPTRRELDEMGRRRVEPLHVVDRDRDRAVARNQTQCVQETERERALIRYRRDAVREEQRHLERRALRARQPREHFFDDARQQIRDAGERQPGIRLRGPRGQNSVTALLRQLGGSPPEGRLADPRRPLQQQRRGRARPVGEELGDHPELVLPAEHSRRRPHNGSAAILAQPVGGVYSPDSQRVPLGRESRRRFVADQCQATTAAGVRTVGSRGQRSRLVHYGRGVPRVFPIRRNSARLTASCTSGYQSGATP